MRPKVYKFLLLATIIAFGVGLILYGSSRSITFFLTSSQILQTRPTNTVRLGGVVKASSINYIDVNKVTFIVTDNVNDIKVEYKGAIPMLFRDLQGVVLRGKMQGDTFVASQMLAKHDEAYFPPTAANSR